MRHEKLFLALLLAVGALLRFWDLPSIEFKGDEKEALKLGIQLLESKPWASANPWPAIGMVSSNGVFNPPLFNYFMALFWKIAPHPVYATALVGLVNWLCLYPLFVWFKRNLGTERSLVALGVIALSPFAILYSRKLWAQDLLLPGITLVLWGLQKMRTPALFWRGLIFVVLGALLVGQLHQSGPIALVVLAIAMVLQRRSDRLKGVYRKAAPPSVLEGLFLVLAVGLNIFFWFPYFNYLLTVPREVFANRPKVQYFAPELLLKLSMQVVPLEYWYFIYDRVQFFTEWGNGIVSWILRTIGFVGAVVTAVPLALYGFFQWWRWPLTLPVVGMWWIGVLITFTIARIPSFAHYVLILTPLPALIIAGAFEPPGNETPFHRWIKGMRWAHLWSLGCLSFGMLLWISARGGSVGDFGVTYRIRAAQAEAIIKLARGDVATGHEHQVEPFEAMGFTCNKPNVEVEWLVGWLGQPVKIVIPPALRICDGWTQKSGGRVYRWAIQMSG